MSLQVFLNFIMLCLVGGAIGVLYWSLAYWTRLKLINIQTSIIQTGMDTMPSLFFMLFRCVIVGMSIGLMIASFISW